MFTSPSLVAFPSLLNQTENHHSEEKEIIDDNPENNDHMDVDQQEEDVVEDDAPVVDPVPDVPQQQQQQQQQQQHQSPILNVESLLDIIRHDVGCDFYLKKDTTGEHVVVPDKNDLARRLALDRQKKTTATTTHATLFQLIHLEWLANCLNASWMLRHALLDIWQPLETRFTGPFAALVDASKALAKFNQSRAELSRMMDNPVLDLKRLQEIFEWTKQIDHAYDHDAPALLDAVTTEFLMTLTYLTRVELDLIVYAAEFQRLVSQYYPSDLVNAILETLTSGEIRDSGRGVFDCQLCGRALHPSHWKELPGYHLVNEHADRVAPLAVWPVRPAFHCLCCALRMDRPRFLGVLPPGVDLGQIQALIKQQVTEPMMLTPDWQTVLATIVMPLLVKKLRSHFTSV